MEISRILNTGLDMETLSICVRLCEQGINPEALSSVIKELRKATEALKVRDLYVYSKERCFIENGEWNLCGRTCLNVIKLVSVTIRNSENQSLSNVCSVTSTAPIMDYIVSSQKSPAVFRIFLVL